jgi:hypothetical protein
MYDLLQDYSLARKMRLSSLSAVAANMKKVRRKLEKLFLTL